MVANALMLTLPMVEDKTSEQEVEMPLIEDVKFRIRGIKKIILMPEFKALIPYFLYLGYSVAINTAFPYKIISYTLADSPINVKNERISWCYVGQGVVAVINSSAVGWAFDVFGMKKTINITNYGFLVSMLFAFLAQSFSQFIFAFLMCALWVFGDSSIRTVSNAIIGKDFKGRLDAFAANRVLSEAGVIGGLILTLLFSNFSPYWLILLTVLFTVGLQYSFNRYDSEKAAHAMENESTAV